MRAFHFEYQKHKEYNFGAMEVINNSALHFLRFRLHFDSILFSSKELFAQIIELLIIKVELQLFSILYLAVIDNQK